MTILQIDFSHSQAIQEYIFGAVIIMLIGAVTVIWLAFRKEQDDNRKFLKDVIEILGETKEVIRNNTDLMNQIKGKL